MIVLHSDVRVYLACGYTDMGKGMQGLAMLVQQVLAEDPFNEPSNVGRAQRLRRRRSPRVITSIRCVPALIRSLA